MAKVASDFIEIELTDAAVELIGAESALRVVSHHVHYLFAPGKSVRVLTSEWSRILSREMLDGVRLFQVAEPKTRKTSTKNKSQEAEAPAEGE